MRRPLLGLLAAVGLAGCQTAVPAPGEAPAAEVDAAPGEPVALRATAVGGDGAHAPPAPRRRPDFGVPLDSDAAPAPDDEPVPAAEPTEAALPPERSAPPPAPAQGVGGPDFAAVFATVSPTVVGVAVDRAASGRFEPDRTGTGFVWDDRGHVVTNEHLVGGGKRIRVRTMDGRVLEAAVVGRDEPTDLAVLRVARDGLYPVRRGDATALRPGEWVAAIGNPFGMHHSITVGVVSALGRRDLPPGGPKYADFIQTDLNINPGNSGGPLVNAHGQVVGLNTAVLDNAQGLAFATPMDMVETVVERLLADGRFVRGFGGLIVKPVSRSAALDARLDTVRGARVSRVVEKGPAAVAGLEPGDIILRYDRQPVEDAHELPWLIARTRPGTVVPLDVARGAERLDLQLPVAEAK